jgi:hypothetical protein
LTEFIAHPVFQELPLAVHQAVNNYLERNPSLEIPKGWPQVVGLKARVIDYVNRSGHGKKGMPSFFPFRRLFDIDSAAIAAANIRGSKGKKGQNAVVTSSVRSSLSSFTLFTVSYYSRSQGKRIRVSNDKVDSDDEVAKFFDKSADAPNGSKESGADSSGKVSVPHFFFSFFLRLVQASIAAPSKPIVIDIDQSNSMDIDPGKSRNSLRSFSREV